MKKKTDKGGISEYGVEGVVHQGNKDTFYSPWKLKDLAESFPA